ncbi:hypothetical protein [Parahaliea mediterranea]|uniref:hypothetical protein n=1 Tax=Parahaliea mediterranea TaxID=651086 RepID=UPI000E2F79FE|nr:hypothetical protein [Parahaliea mediterranea]
MRKDVEQQEASAADALQVVSDAGLKRLGLHDRIATILRIPRWLLFSLEAIVLVSACAYLWLDAQPLPVADSPVAVLLPSEKALSVRGNMERQREGFLKAWEENRIEPRLRYYQFPLHSGTQETVTPLPPDPGSAPPLEDVNQLMLQLQAWYDEGVRVFIVTMSGSALKIRDRFKQWTQAMPDDEKPILIATVASAPDIADAKHGIFRHYIRSEDESWIFSRYIDQRAAEQDFEVILIQIQDTYGDHARRTLIKNGLALKSTIVIPTTMARADYAAAIRLDFSADDAIQKFVVVVGYGEMIETTLEVLRHMEEQFDAQQGARLIQEVLVVSTFTEPLWQPTRSLFSRSLYKRVRTLGPVMGDRERRGIGVVYQFSLLTLDKAIYCARQQDGEWHGLQPFGACWEKPDSFASRAARDLSPIIELLANGDTHIPLQVLAPHEL